MASSSSAISKGFDRIAAAMARRSSVSTSGKPDMMSTGTSAVRGSAFSSVSSDVQEGREPQVEQYGGRMCVADDACGPENRIPRFDFVAIRRQDTGEHSAQILIIFNDQDTLAVHCFLCSGTLAPAPGSDGNPTSRCLSEQAAFGCAAVGRYLESGRALQHARGTAPHRSDEPAPGLAGEPGFVANTASANPADEASWVLAC